MSRITINSVILSAAVAALVMAPGCGKKYPRQDVGTDSPTAQEVRSMVGRLQSAGADGLEEAIARQAAGGLTAVQSKSLRASLAMIAKAETVELEDLSQFGRDVYRASLRLQSAGGTSATVCMLLVRSGGTLHWAGQN